MRGLRGHRCGSGRHATYRWHSLPWVLEPGQKVLGESGAGHEEGLGVGEHVQSLEVLDSRRSTPDRAQQTQLTEQAMPWERQVGGGDA